MEIESKTQDPAVQTKPRTRRLKPPEMHFSRPLALLDLAVEERLAQLEDFRKRHPVLAFMNRLTNFFRRAGDITWRWYR